MMLNSTISGADSDAPPVLLAHGLFGSGRNLSALARRLGAARQVVSVDMRNHGDSFRDPDHSYPVLGRDLAGVIEAHGGRSDVVGHSMGGKAAMALALTAPERVGRLVVLDIAPVAYGHSQTTLIDAMEALDLGGLRLRSEADRRLSADIDDPAVRAFLLQSLDLKADEPRWKINLKVLRDEMDRLVGWPDELRGRAYDRPALFVVGADSDYVDAEGEEAINSQFPAAEIMRIDGAGHWLHADKPEEVASAVAAFLEG